MFDIVTSTCSNETVTLNKHMTKYENMRKWMDQFIRKFENRDIKIDRVNSIRIIKSINGVTVLGVRCDDIFKLTTRA